MSQKSPVDDFKWTNNKISLYEGFTKSYYKNRENYTSLKLILIMLRSYRSL